MLDVQLVMSSRAAATLVVRLAAPKLTPVAKAAQKHEVRLRRLLLRRFREAQAAVPMGELRDALRVPGTGATEYAMQPVLDMLLEETGHVHAPYYRKMAASGDGTVAGVLGDALVGGAEATELCVLEPIKSTGKFEREQHDKAVALYRQSKGTDSVANRSLLNASGVKVTAPAELQAAAERAAAHVLSERRFAERMAKIHVEVKDLKGLYGKSLGNKLLVDARALREGGPGFGATIIRHELEHTVLTDAGISTGLQESRVRHTSGMWAAQKYSSMAITNPADAAGFKSAAIKQGIKWTTK